MNPEVKTKWVSALRSGEYPQTRGTLRRLNPSSGGPPSGFCCLGVLCEIAAQEGVIPFGQRSEEEDVLDYLGAYSMPPSQVKEWADLEEAVEHRLIDLNDGERRNFSEIADWIEENL